MPSYLLEKHIGGWEEFVQVLRMCPVALPPGMRYIFRGQANAAWDLDPSLLRHCLSHDLTPLEAIEVESVAMADFQVQAHVFIPEALALAKDDTFHLWQLMQHYGAPTRLLDWTASPYIAAYFAVESLPHVPGAVWIIDVESVAEAMQRRHPFYGRPSLPVYLDREPGCVDREPALYFLAARFHTDRMIAQQTVFTLSTQVVEDHSYIISEAVQADEPQLRFAKLVIPNEVKLAFLRRLREMNINGRSLFPGIDGAGRAVAELVKLTLGSEGV